jgi:hypothetical protein
MRYFGEALDLGTDLSTLIVAHETGGLSQL